MSFYYFIHVDLRKAQKRCCSVIPIYTDTKVFSFVVYKDQYDRQSSDIKIDPTVSEQIVYVFNADQRWSIIVNFTLLFLFQQNIVVRSYVNIFSIVKSFSPHC